jgi:hypothetical protein
MIDYNAPWWPHSPPSGTDATLLCLTMYNVEEELFSCDVIVSFRLPMCRIVTAVNGC